MIAQTAYLEIFKHSKKNAGLKGLDFEITKEQFLMMVERAADICEVSGLPFSLEPYRNARRRPFAPSIDRINNRKGYLVENCRLVCVVTNYVMNDWVLNPSRYWPFR